jgi:peptidoglycan/xylan/chitin deacetylase (PgdA/CDA1 family)
MRFVAFVAFCLVGGIASAIAQPAPVEVSATPASVQPPAQPAEQQIAKPADPLEKLVEERAKKSVEQPANKPDEQRPVKSQEAAKPVEQPVAKPLEQQASKPIDEPGKQPAAKLNESKPDEQKLDEQQPAKPAEQPAQQVAQTCPGNPAALGTSRVLTIVPAEFSRIGTMQYKQTLPLDDHEVVLTFDDGPIPPYSNEILDILDANCVKATYFMVGEMARHYPSIVRRIYNAGHTIGTHSQTHPFAFQRLSQQSVEGQVDGGIASVDAALGDPKALAPFFRIPGLGRTNAIEHFLQSKGLVTWSADIDTNDWWRGSRPGQIVQRAMRRLNAKGRGILLMHDIHPATVLALPMLLKELKAGGYHVVQVVPSGERPKTLPELVATPAEDKHAWPRVVRTSTTKSSQSSAAGRHHIKKLVAGKRHRVKTASLPGKDSSSGFVTPDWQTKPY